jgi:hypothetical protein
VGFFFKNKKNMALDYAYACDNNGILRCYNTHGSTNQDEWSLVHNSANCIGTATDIPNCLPKPVAPSTNRKTRATTLANGKIYGLATPTIEKYKNLERYKNRMLADLDFYKIPVEDRNNIYLISVLWAATNPYMGSYVSDKDLQSLFATMRMTGKKESFDFASLFGAIADTIGQLVDGINQGNNATALKNWTIQFGRYMTTDFADINRELTSKGAPQALSWLLQLKGTSWKDLNNYINGWLNQYQGFTMPTEVQQLRDQQATLEQQLRVQSGAAPLPFPANVTEGGITVVPVGQPANSGITSTLPSPIPPTGTLPTGNNGNNGNNGTGNFMDSIEKYLPYILVAVVVLVVLMRRK